MFRYYLGGPIRENMPEDVLWRSKIAEKYPVYDPILNNLITITNEKVFNQSVFARDFMMIKKADGGIFNMLPFSTGYPCIGALIEIGMLLDQNKPVCVICDPRSGLTNHPMLVQTIKVATIEEAIDCFYGGINE